MFLFSSSPLKTTAHYVIKNRFSNTPCIVSNIVNRREKILNTTDRKPLSQTLSTLISLGTTKKQLIITLFSSPQHVKQRTRITMKFRSSFVTKHYSSLPLLLRNCFILDNSFSFLLSLTSLSVPLDSKCFLFH